MGDEASASRAGNRRGYRRCRLPPSRRLKVLIVTEGTGVLAGRVIDISRSGAKIVLDRHACGSPRGTECFVRLLDAGEELRPHTVAGTVRRQVAEAGAARVAVQFQEPLRFFSVPSRQLGRRQ